MVMRRVSAWHSAPQTISTRGFVLALPSAWNNLPLASSTSSLRCHVPKGPTLTIIFEITPSYTQIATFFSHSTYHLLSYHFTYLCLLLILCLLLLGCKFHKAILEGAMSDNFPELWETQFSEEVSQGSSRINKHKSRCMNTKLEHAKDRKIFRVTKGNEKFLTKKH